MHATTREMFARAVITSVKELALRDITEADRLGHEPLGDIDEICAIYKNFYHQHITPANMMKIIRFELIKT